MVLLIGKNTHVTVDPAVPVEIFPGEDAALMVLPVQTDRIRHRIRQHGEGGISADGQSGDCDLWLSFRRGLDLHRLRLSFFAGIVAVADFDDQGMILAAA